MRKFESLTLKGQKMRIVKDAIAQIIAKKFIAKSANYLQLIKGDFSTDSLQTILKSENLKCECCAKGALFASCVIETNKVNIKQDYGKEYFQKNKLKKWFDLSELDLIEMAFEGVSVIDSNNILHDINRNPTELYLKGKRFYRKYKSNKTRLLAILNNILENGKFTL